MGKAKIFAIRAVVRVYSLCERAVPVLLLIFSASTFAAPDQDSRLWCISMWKRRVSGWLP